MAPSSKAEKKAAVDAAAWMFNVVTSVGIIIVNKALMGVYGFSFGKFLYLFLNDISVTDLLYFVLSQLIYHKTLILILYPPLSMICFYCLQLQR